MTNGDPQASLARRTFLRGGAAGALAVPLLASGAWARSRGGRPAHDPAELGGLTQGEGPYGPLQPPDALGLMLPAGFIAREIARAQNPVAATGYSWHIFPDGGATFATDDDGWIYVSNSEQLEEGKGGVSAVRFDSGGEIVDAYRILDGTTMNCAGGATPWDTWLSGEEHEKGRIWECDPFGERPAEPRDAMGVFPHEAAAVDPDREVVYLTEDVADGRFYRFTPDAYPDLSAGKLEVAKVDEGGGVTWLEVPDPSAASTETRHQVADSTVFAGGEGIFYREGHVYFVTKIDMRIWLLDTESDTMGVFYDATKMPDPVTLDALDNLIISSYGEIFVAEDKSDDQEVCVITPEGEVAPLLRQTGHSGSELTGIAFDPSGTRLYLSSQRGGDSGGVTYEVSGPFRLPTEPPTTTGGATTTGAGGAATTAAPTTSGGGTGGAAAGGGDDDDGFPVLPVVGGGAAVVALAAAGIWRLRTRRP